MANYSEISTSNWSFKLTSSNFPLSVRASTFIFVCIFVERLKRLDPSQDKFPLTYPSPSELSTRTDPCGRIGPVLYHGDGQARKALVVDTPTANNELSW